METEEKYVDHEVRIRIQEQNALELKTEMRELRNMVHSQFQWTLGIMITLFGGLVFTKFI